MENAESPKDKLAKRPRLYELRKAKFKTQGEFLNMLEEMFGIRMNQSTYSNYEKGMNEPSISMAQRFAKVLGTTVNDLYPFDDGEITEVGDVEEIPIDELRMRYFVTLMENERLKKKLHNYDSIKEAIKKISNRID